MPGVGEKTATKWIVDYGSLEKLLEKSGELGGKVGESLRTMSWRMSGPKRQLTTGRRPGQTRLRRLWLQI